jgi:hypothetical protein
MTSPEPTIDWEGIGGSVVTDTADGIEEVPYGVYDVCRIRCSIRAVRVSPVQAEALDLWECHRCRTMSMTWHPYPDEEDDDAE